MLRVCHVLEPPAGRDIPELNVAFAAVVRLGGRHGHAAVRAEAHDTDAGAMRELEASRIGHSGAAELADAVVAAREQAAPIRTECDGAHTLLVIGGRTEAFTASNIPEPRDLIGAGREKSLAARAKGERTHLAGMRQLVNRA